MKILLAKRLTNAIIDKNLISDHQFGIIRQQSTIEQAHRVVDTILKTFKEKSY